MNFLGIFSSIFLMGISRYVIIIALVLWGMNTLLHKGALDKPIEIFRSATGIDLKPNVAELLKAQDELINSMISIITENVGDSKIFEGLKKGPTKKDPPPT